MLEITVIFCNSVFDHLIYSSFFALSCLIQILEYCILEIVFTKKIKLISLFNSMNKHHT